jgi:integrase/recombinase XerD
MVPKLQLKNSGSKTMRKNSNVVKFDDWPAHHRIGLEQALAARRRHNKRRMRFKWGADMLRGVRASWGRWLFWARGQSWFDAEVPIEALLSPERVEAFVAHLIVCGNKPATIRHRMIGLERMMAALAPDTDRDWLNAIKWRFPKTGDRRAKRARIQFADDLIRFAAALANTAEELARIDPLAGARLFCVALQIMWLAYRPMRLKNFHQLRFKEEVKCVEGVWQLDIPKLATKRGNAYDPVLPARLVGLLECFRKRHVIELGGSPDDGPLWMFGGDKQETARMIYYYICKETKKAFGKSMCPHLFRDAVMTTIASQMPEHVRMGMHLVGNRDQDCMADHYDQSLRVIADNRYNAALDAWEDAV